MARNRDRHNRNKLRFSARLPFLLPCEPWSWLKWPVWTHYVWTHLPRAGPWLKWPLRTRHEWKNDTVSGARRAALKWPVWTRHKWTNDTVSGARRAGLKWPVWTRHEWKNGTVSGARRAMTKMTRVNAPRMKERYQSVTVPCLARSGPD